MNKKLILLAAIVFTSNIQSQPFFEKYYKQIYAATVGVLLFIIYKSENKAFVLKREIWRKKYSTEDRETQTDGSDSAHEKLKSEKYIYPREIKSSKLAKDDGSTRDEFEFYG